jgi:hypothetical protein
MEIFSKGDLVFKLKQIRDNGWVKNLRPGNAGVEYAEATISSIIDGSNDPLTDSSKDYSKKYAFYG